MPVLTGCRYESVIDEIADLDWEGMSQVELIRAAWAYYFFSVHFRESLQIAVGLHPQDDKLQQLKREECNTDNLSPWPGVATEGERMNHDEFMRRLLELLPITESDRLGLEAVGASYLRTVRALSPATSAMSIASYEDGGLEAVFRAFLKAKPWEGPLLLAFKHFLTEHIRFDSDPEQGHGALSRHLQPDDQILPAWSAFRDLLTEAVPGLVNRAPGAS